MMGEREHAEPMFYYVTIEQLVPKDHFLRMVDSTIDFSFIRPMVKHLYSHTGKPSIDPEVLIKMRSDVNSGHQFRGQIYEVAMPL
ncbi:MAG: hypothetical protein A3D30_10780 [Deltaproteobacteria bacterium RIFCSPHIGHO2_02_FULL_43_33]|nr:MAG: hypothetical protein A3D30_10780 [Deltaproteobacteria bacterium RIFCSPHIGHO2_02_FULL_43_33]